MARSLYGKSVRGATHIKNGLPCQDNLLIESTSEDISILAVADGHGSEKSPRSKKGSQVAVKVFRDTIAQYMVNYAKTPEDLITYLNRDGQLKFAQDICSRWQKVIRKAYNSTKEKPPITRKADGTVNWEEVYRLYGTTLVGLMVAKTYIFGFQIGDGDMMLIDKDSITPVVETEKILGTETHSLSKTDAWKKAVSVVRRRDADANKPYLYMLSSDGFVNSHASEEEYLKTCRDYYNMIGEHGFDKVCSNLGNWLSETSALGCGDDITVVLAYID